MGFSAKLKGHDKIYEKVPIEVGRSALLIASFDCHNTVLPEIGFRISPFVPVYTFLSIKKEESDYECMIKL